jgi:hypothetical protein
MLKNGGQIEFKQVGVGWPGQTKLLMHLLSSRLVKWRQSPLRWRGRLFLSSRVLGVLGRPERPFEPSHDRIKRRRQILHQMPSGGSLERRWGSQAPSALA